MVQDLHCERGRTFDKAKNSQLVGLAMAGGVAAMSDITMSAPPPIISRNFSGARSSRKSSCENATPGISGMWSRSMAITRPLPSTAPTRLAAISTPTAGRGPEIDHNHSGFQNPVLVIDLAELISRAGTKSIPLGLRDVRIIQLTFQPKL